MKRLIYCLPLVLTLIAVITCKEPEYDYFGTISGVVTDAQTQNMLSGVKVTLSPGGLSQMTSDDGTFSFEELEPQEYTVTFTRDGYSDLTQKVSVVSGEQSSVQVAMEALLPELTLEPDVLDFGRDSSTLVIDIINNGANELKWEITENIEWLSCEPSSGTTTTGSTPVVFTASRTGLQQGEYNESLVISSNGGSRTVQVHMTVSDMRLNITPDILDFGTLLSSIEMTLENTSGKPMEWSAAAANDWLILSKSSGTISGKDFVNAIAIRDGLSAGDYNSSISFLMNGGETVIPVKMSVAVNEKPTVTIETVSGVAYNSASLSGTIVSPGSSKISRYGFCWSEHEEPTIEDSFSNLGDCSAPTAFEGSATNLKPETTYHVRAYAENSVGLVYSERELSFTTSSLPELPVVKSTGFSDITSTGAKASGTIVSFGNVQKISAYGHVWSESPAPTLESGQSTDLGETLEEPTSFVSGLTDLKPHTRYYVRAYAVNEIGTAYSADSTFETAKTDVILTTLDVTDIVHDAATCGGSISDDGGHIITERGVCWSTSPDPTVGDNSTVAQYEEFICRMTGLEKKTDYYVRAYVRTSEDRVFYGDGKEFTTTEVVSLPELTDVTVSNIRTDGATVVSRVQSDGNSTVLASGFVYSVQADPTLDNGTALQCDPASAELGKSITGLAEGTLYYVRSFATNAMGTAYSRSAQFTTLEITIPQLSAVTVSNIGRTSASVSATLVSDGNSQVTERGFCWATNPYPTVYDNKVACGEESSFTTKLQNLPLLSTVYVRAYAINSKGTGYSEDVSFMTTDTDVDVWDGYSAADRFGGGSGSEADPIIINSADQLKLLANNVNEGTRYSGIFFKLSIDINLNNMPWTPIGNETNYFSGSFDGSGHTISGLNINSSQSNTGLFGFITGSSTIKNLNVSGNIRGGNNVGGICGYAENFSTFSNCNSNCSISGNSNIGGILGRVESDIDIEFQIYNCTNTGDISGVENIGGIVGYSKCYGYNSGRYAKHTFSNNLNRGHISASNSCAGGIIGYLYNVAGTYYGTSTTSLFNCINYSDVSSVEYSGGLVGGGSYHSNSDSEVIIENSYWLFDLVNNIGLESGFGIDLDVVGSYFTRSSSSCFLISGNDLVSSLNEWINNSADYNKYLHWKYEIIDGFACPVLEK